MEFIKHNSFDPPIISEGNSKIGISILIILGIAGIAAIVYVNNKRQKESQKEKSRT